MKLSELWLREWVNPPLNEQQLADLLTLAGLEVDTVSPVAGDFDHVIVAQVLNTAPHPQANRLTLCEVDSGSGNSLKIVCGAANVRAGLKVALAQMGAHLPGGLLIKESTIRGELSQGMLCSLAELGLAEASEGIMELADNAPLGVDLRIYLALNDHILDIDLTPNRADCLSVLGIAREVSALTKLPHKLVRQEVNRPTIDESLAVSLEAKDACPRYAGRIIRDINSHAQTPSWMSERLRRAGLRAIHPVVDVTNYVMLELGQPMHAFDVSMIKEEIIVRFAHEDETLELLDGQEVKLNKKVLVITDREKPLAIAGVMGGQASAVQEQTKNIFLESAYFNPPTIAGVARSYGLSSDSSQRFERGVDPHLQVLALERATEILLDIVGGKAGPVVLSETSGLPQEVTVQFNPKKVKQITGMTVTTTEMAEIFQGLGMTVAKGDDFWSVKIPSYRFDITQEQDLVEEIARVYGYDKMIGEKITTTMQAGMINPYDSLSVQIGNFLTSRGYHETISYSFVDPELQKVLYPHVEKMQLLNPISSELAEMRAGMWPGLLASMVYNTHRQQPAIQFFENGVIFDLQEGNLQEHPCIAGLLVGDRGATNWSEKTRKFDFYDVKGDLQALFAFLHLKNAVFESAEHPGLHPGKSAKIVIDGHLAGWCGVLHPRVSDALDLQDNEVILFELRLSALINKPLIHYQQISKFPLIRRDLSMLVDNEVTAAQIESAVRQVVSADWLKAFDVFDVYTGESIPVGKKSLAIALTLQDNNRTMIDSEINTIISAIIKKLNEEFSIILRD